MAGPGGVLQGPATNCQQGIAGSESEFAARVSQRAREPGMSHSRFANAWGNSSGGQRVTVRDMARLAAHVISTYPQFYH
jgi:serine-type D-Ala-D-Ala carboxypeptidase (penicillin-binding protein 5/6)